jgi:hypothetical protein
MGTRVLVFITQREARRQLGSKIQRLLPLPERAVVQGDNGFFPAKVTGFGIYYTHLNCTMMTQLFSFSAGRAVTKFPSQILLCKKKILITSKCRHMYGVLNVDEIKN